MLEDRQARFFLAQSVLLASLFTWPLIGYIAHRWGPPHPVGRSLKGALHIAVILALLSVGAILQLSALAVGSSWTGYWARACLHAGCLYWLIGGANLVVLGIMGSWLVARGIPKNYLMLLVVFTAWIEASAGVQVVALWAMNKFGYLGP